VVDEQSGESEEEEVMGEGMGTLLLSAHSLLLFMASVIYGTLYITSNAPL